MKLTTKIKKSWWVLLSFIIFFNGLGFVYIGHKTNNKNWVIEGIIYEIPWFFVFIHAFNKDFITGVVIFGLLLLCVSIIRSILVARRLIKAYEAEEKRTFVNHIFINDSKDDDEKDNGEKEYNLKGDNSSSSSKNINDSKSTSATNSKNNNYSNKSKTTNFSSKNNSTKSDSSGDWKGCCLCLVGIFIILGFISIL